MKIFLSSTFLDLKEYREAVFHVVHSLGGYTDDMSYWPASEKEAAFFSVERVRRCDAMILVLAHRYGYVPPNNEFSVTELEYRAAREAKIPVYAFFADESTPWPPNLIEWEKRENLAAFKKMVANDVIFQTFTSPEALATKVAQALALFREKNSQTIYSMNRFDGRARGVVAPAYLRTDDNVLILMGKAEDDLPLLLSVRQEQGSSDPINELDGDLPVAVRHSEAFANFKRSYESLAAHVLAENRIKHVRLRDGTTRELYVAQPNLTRLFKSSLSVIMDSIRTSASTASQAQSPSPPLRPGERATARLRVIGEATDPKNFLQSVDGSNRFLGISPLDGNIYSVGRQEDEWVEWHAFLMERLTPHFPDALFFLKSSAQGLRTVGVTEYRAALTQIAIATAHQDGRIPIEVYMELSRQAIGHLILNVGRSLVDLHLQGFVHGDIKPSNVILTGERPELMDYFLLKEGETAPGWTPDWSAPEQILGDPVSFRSDIYPMGRMLSDLLSGFLVGEVRKFKTPPLSDGKTEFDIFYNPSTFISLPELVLANDKGLRPWLALVKSCMRFRPEERPSLAEFIERLTDLLENYPLLGGSEISMPNNLLAVVLPDGQEAVARVIEVVEPPWSV